MKKFLKDMFTGVDNQTYDQTRVLCFLSFIVYFIMAIVSYGFDGPWEAMEFASGIGTMTIAFGLNLYIKKSTEPQGSTKNVE